MRCILKHFCLWRTFHTHLCIERFLFFIINASYSCRILQLQNVWGLLVHKYCIHNKIGIRLTLICKEFLVYFTDTNFWLPGRIGRVICMLLAIPKSNLTSLLILYMMSCVQYVKIMLRWSYIELGDLSFWVHTL